MLAVLSQLAMLPWNLFHDAWIQEYHNGLDAVILSNSLKPLKIPFKKRNSDQCLAYLTKEQCDSEAKLKALTCMQICVLNYISVQNKLGKWHIQSSVKETRPQRTARERTKVLSLKLTLWALTKEVNLEWKPLKALHSISANGYLINRRLTQTTRRTVKAGL